MADIDDHGAESAVPEHYETLQVSPSADPLIITKAYRVLAALYHPDNKQHGDVEVFQRVLEAYRILSDPVSRAAYDRGRRIPARAANGGGARPAALPAGADQPPADERDLRRMILQITYSLRRSRPFDPGIELRTLAEMCGCGIDDLQFSLWYLRGKKLIETTSDGQTAITVAGVDAVDPAGGVTGSAAVLSSVRELPESFEGLPAFPAEAAQRPMIAGPS
jgi:curved DNA-binding protein CbpA